MTELLVQAKELLDDKNAVPQQSVLFACWLARAAFEKLLTDQVKQAGLLPERQQERTHTKQERPNTSSLLICFEAQLFELDKHRIHRKASAEKPSVQLVRDMYYAWAELSNACHQHAYELTPTVDAARHLLSLVEKLAAVTKNL